MTVGQLLDRLRTIDPSLPVVITYRDFEGDDFASLADMTEVMTTEALVRIFGLSLSAAGKVLVLKSVGD